MLFTGGFRSGQILNSYFFWWVADWLMSRCFKYCCHICAHTVCCAVWLCRYVKWYCTNRCFLVECRLQGLPAGHMVQRPDSEDMEGGSSAAEGQCAASETSDRHALLIWFILMIGCCGAAVCQWRGRGPDGGDVSECGVREVISGAWDSTQCRSCCWKPAGWGRNVSTQQICQCRWKMFLTFSSPLVFLL